MQGSSDVGPRVTGPASLRLVHTSDTHLGHQQYPAIGPNGLNQRENDIYAAWHAAVDHAVATRPDLFIHAGDLFDSVRPGNRALAHGLEGFLKLSKAGIPTVAIAGNHEHPKLRETGSPFRLFQHLDGIHVAYQARAETIRLQVRGQEVRVHAVPQCADNQALQAAIAELPTHRSGEPGVDVLVVHGAVSGLPAFSHGESNELHLDPSWFRPFHYVALGHYHGTQQVAPNAWYCGAPERVSIAEAGQAKGFLDVTVTPEAVRADLVPWPGRAYRDLPRLDAAGLSADDVRAAAERSVAQVPNGAVARLRIENLDPALRGALDVRALQRAGRHALHFDLKLAWADQALAVRGSPQVGALADEFSTFLAHQVVEGIDRATLAARAKALLEEPA